MVIVICAPPWPPPGMKDRISRERIEEVYDILCDLRRTKLSQASRLDQIVLDDEVIKTDHEREMICRVKLPKHLCTGLELSQHEWTLKRRLEHTVFVDRRRVAAAAVIPHRSSARLRQDHGRVHAPHKVGEHPIEVVKSFVRLRLVLYHLPRLRGLWQPTASASASASATATAVVVFGWQNARDRM